MNGLLLQHTCIGVRWALKQYLTPLPPCFIPPPPLYLYCQIIFKIHLHNEPSIVSLRSAWGTCPGFCPTTLILFSRLSLLGSGSQLSIMSRACLPDAWCLMCLVLQPPGRCEMSSIGGYRTRYMSFWSFWGSRAGPEKKRYINRPPPPPTYAIVEGGMILKKINVFGVALSNMYASCT